MDFFTRNELLGQHGRYGLMLTLTLMIALTLYYPVLNYHFTDSDTTIMIYSAQVNTWSDLKRILTTPLKSRVNQKSPYFRPITTLSLSLDHWLWGLRPIGYQLTNLLLHLGVAGLLFQIVHCLSRGDLAASTLAGLFYTLHPLLVETVPVAMRRQEMLASVFGMAALWASWHYEHEKGSVFFLGAGLGSLVLSMGSKEVAVVFIPLIILHIALWSREEFSGFFARFRRLFVKSLPYLGAGAFYFTVWASVTNARAFWGGELLWRSRVMGSTLGESLQKLLIESPSWVIPFYFRALLHPFVGLIRGFRETLSFMVPEVVSFGSFQWILGLILFAGLVWGLGRLRSSWAARGVQAFVSPPFFLLFVAGLSLGLYFLFPFYESLLDGMVRQAYHDEGFSWLAVFMEGRSQVPLERYQSELRMIARASLVALTALSAGIVCVWKGYQNGLELLERCLPWVEESSLLSLFFHSVWLLLPLLVYTITRTRGYDISYHGVLPLSALMGTLGSCVIGYFLPLGNRWLAKDGNTSPTGSPTTSITASSVLVVAFVCGLLMVSPLTNDYRGWYYIQKVNGKYTRALERHLPSIPPGSTIELKAIPFTPARLTGEFPHVLFFNAILHYRFLIKARFPGKDFKVDVDSYHPVVQSSIQSPPPDSSRLAGIFRAQFPDGFSMKIERQPRGSHYFRLIARTGSGP